MLRSIIFALGAIPLFSSLALAADLEICAEGTACCQQQPPRRALTRRTDTCPANSGPKQCCSHYTTVLKLQDSRDLQCGSKGEKKSTVTTTVETCPNSAEQCLHVAYANVATTTFNEVHLQLSPSVITNSAPGKFSFNDKCTIAPGGSTADCWVPISAILKLYTGVDQTNPLSLCNKDLYIAAHATISDGNTCWGVGPLIGGTGNWAMNFKLTFGCVQICDKYCCCPSSPPPPPPSNLCQFGTAFAYNPACGPTQGDQCDYYITKVCSTSQRWGWWFAIDATTLPQTYDLYVGAGQGDITKGTKVGTVKVEKLSTGIQATYSFNDGYQATHTHMDVSCATLLSQNKACAPGQYNIPSDTCPVPNPWTGQFTTDCPGGIYNAIFHAAVSTKTTESTCSNGSTPNDCSVIDPPDPKPT